MDTGLNIQQIIDNYFTQDNKPKFIKGFSKKYKKYIELTTEELSKRKLKGYWTLVGDVRGFDKYYGQYSIKYKRYITQKHYRKYLIKKYL